MIYNCLESKPGCHCEPLGEALNGVGRPGLKQRCQAYSPLNRSIQCSCSIQPAGPHSPWALVDITQQQEGKQKPEVTLWLLCLLPLLSPYLPCYYLLILWFDPAFKEPRNLDPIQGTG